MMLYCVKDVPATLAFFRSLLAPNGKLLIILESGNSGWSTLYNNHGSRLPFAGFSADITGGAVAHILTSQGAKFKSYELPSDMDITECFTDGDRNGDLLMDFLMQTCDFNKTAPAELREGVMRDLRGPGCSAERDGKVIFNNSLSALVVEGDEA